MLKNATSLENFGRLNEAQEREPRQFLDEQLYAYVKTLTNQISKAFRWLERQPAGYQERLEDMGLLLKMTKQGYEFFAADPEKAARFAFISLDNLYYLHDQLLTTMRETATRNKVDFSDEFYAVVDTRALIDSLCRIIYKSSHEKLINRALCLHVHHHSIHDRQKEARNLLLTSRIPENIGLLDQNTQVHYNRAIVQLGLCHFRRGDILKCHAAISQIFGSMRLRTVLGQINPPKSDRKLVPHHKHFPR